MKRILSQISSSLRTSGGSGTGTPVSSKNRQVPIRASASVSTSGAGTSRTPISPIIRQPPLPPPPVVSQPVVPSSYPQSDLPLTRPVVVTADVSASHLQKTNASHQPKLSFKHAEIDPAEIDRSVHYNQLLNSVMDLVLGHEYHLATSSNNAREVETLISRKNNLKDELSLKRILSKNKGMKEIILKMANTVANEMDGESSSGGFIHPFVPTAGEVFFGANGTSEDTLPNYIQDLLTPGLLVLLMENMLRPLQGKPSSRNMPNGTELTANNVDVNVPEALRGVSKRHLMLAKALVKTTAGYLIHRTVEETNHLEEESPLYKAMHQGNKLATLTGDLLVISLIKNIADTKSNKVLELTMNSLSEFSTTEVAKSLHPFRQLGPLEYESQLPQTLAESEVFSKGFQSVIILSGGMSDSRTQEWAAELGTYLGLLWKTHYDYKKLSRVNGAFLLNPNEFNAYTSELVWKVGDLLKLQENFIYSNGNHSASNLINQLAKFWGSNKS